MRVKNLEEKNKNRKKELGEILEKELWKILEKKLEKDWKTIKIYFKDKYKY